MKKITNVCSSGKRKWQKLILIMKLTLMITVVCLMQVSASVYSQSVKFSFDFHNKQIRDVLKEIEEQSDYRFFYQEEQVDVEREVNIRCSDKTVDEILRDLFETRGISFRLLSGNMILLTSDLLNETAGSLAQQTKTISGKVTDPSGSPLPGVTVVIKGTTGGTITGTDGHYSLTNVPADAVLVFSFVGMRTQEISVAGKELIHVKMTEETIGIEEVVAIGYGTMKKSDLTGSIVSVKSEDIKNLPVRSVTEALQGRVAGVMINKSSGKPGSSSEIIIRGVGSINGLNPLFIIDGVARENNATFNPRDVESIEIIKDASAAAIYGAQAAGGVVLITTKKGYYTSFGINFRTLILKKLEFEGQ